MFPPDVGRLQNPATADSNERINPSINPDGQFHTPSVTSTDGAVGVRKSQWFVGWVSSRAEKKVRDNLLKDNIEAYAAVRQEIHTWRRNERRVVECVLIPSVVFIKTDASMLVSLLKTYNINSFMRDVAKKGTSGLPYAIIPDFEMEVLQAMLSQTDFEVAFTPSQLAVGEQVRVLGFGCDEQLARIVRLPNDSRSYVGIRIESLGCAYMQVPVEKILKIKH